MTNLAPCSTCSIDFHLASRLLATPLPTTASVSHCPANCAACACDSRYWRMRSLARPCGSTHSSLLQPSCSWPIASSRPTIMYSRCCCWCSSSEGGGGVNSFRRFSSLDEPFSLPVVGGGKETNEDSIQLRQRGQLWTLRGREVLTRPSCMQSCSIENSD